MLQLVLLLCLLPLCLAAPQTIVFPTNQAATLVPNTGGLPTLVLQPLNIKDPYQLWNFAGGVISSAAPGFTNYVFDVKGAQSADGTPVILYTPNNPITGNQKWSIDATGGLLSGVSTTTSTYLTPSNGGLVIDSAKPPPQPVFQTPSGKPWICQSVGDPHISPYSTGRNDLYSPGSQQPGTYTLSRTCRSTDACYTVIQADQQLCNPNTNNVYCNKRGIIRTAGQLVEVNGDTVTVNGVAVTVTGTYTVGNGVSVTKNAKGDYTVNYPQGSMRVVNRGYYTDITVTASSGPQPSGGACTQYIGDNVPNLERELDPSSPYALTPYYFLLSWRTPNRSSDLFYYATDLAWRNANPLVFNTSTGHFTTTNATLQALAEKACAPLLNTTKLAIQCAGYAVPNSQDYYQACMDDVIITGGDLDLAAASTDCYNRVCSAYSGNAVPLPTSARNSIASGPGLSASIAQYSPQYFVILARDVNGITVTTGGDAFAVSSTGPASLSFAMAYLGMGRYNVTYTPTVVGIYTIYVSLNSAQIFNSPFSLVVASQTTDASKSTASGDGLGTNLESGLYYSITITAKTSDGTQRNRGGDVVVVKVSGYAFLTPVVDKGDGTYTMTYEQEIVGAFSVTVTINGAQISGSPFRCVTTSKK